MVRQHAEQAIKINCVDGVATQVHGMTRGQALKDWRFWLVTFTLVPLSFAIDGPIPNLETMLGTKGFVVGEAIFLTNQAMWFVMVKMSLMNAQNLDVYVSNLPTRAKELKPAGYRFFQDTYSGITAPDVALFHEIHMPSHDAINVVLLEVPGKKLPFTNQG